MSIEWSEWTTLDQLPDHRGHAVYRIRLCESGTVISIQRFFDCDDEGILCIGKSTNLKRRLKQFTWGITRKRGHYEAHRLYQLESVLNEKFPNRKYEYSFITVDPDEEGELEEKELKAYFNKFGEVPPLNSALPKPRVAV